VSVIGAQIDAGVRARRCPTARPQRLDRATQRCAEAVLKRLKFSNEFCHITENWCGRPLVDHETIVQLIGATLHDRSASIETPEEG